MGQEDLYDRILTALHEVAFDTAVWPEAAGLIDAACGVKGNALVFAGGRSRQDAELYLAQFCFRGQRREDFDRLYFGDYWSRDERLPRSRQLPDSRLIHVSELYTEVERRTCEASPGSGRGAAGAAAAGRRAAAALSDA